MSIYRRSLIHGVVRIFSLPRLSMPLVLTLGLTLGAVLSVIAIVSVLLFKPLPGIQGENNLHHISFNLKISDSLEVSYLNWRRMAAFAQHFADVGEWGAIRADESQVVINDLHYPVVNYTASGNILDVLGTRLIKGQGTDVASPEQKTWISESLWRQAFSGRESVIGKPIQLQDKQYVVAGVIEDLSSVDYSGTMLPQQVWLIKDIATQLAQQETPSINSEVPSLVVRTSNALPTHDELRAWYDNYLVNNSPAPQYLEFVQSKEMVIDSGSYRDSLVAESETLVTMLFAAVIGLLVMASLNLLNLFIAHYQSRAKEFAIQLSLGASLMRLRVMLLLENLPSFLMAAVLGLLASGWALRWVPEIAGEALPLVDRLAVDGLTIVIALMIALLLAVIFSLVGLVHVAKHRLNDSLNSSGKGVQGQTKQWLSRALMVLQLSLASVLLTGSVMLAKQSYDAVYQPLGFALDNAYELSWAYADESWAEELGEFEQYGGSGYQQLHNNVVAALEQLLPGSEIVTTFTAPLSDRIDILPMSDPSLPGQILYMSKEATPNAFSAFDIAFLEGGAPSRAQIDANEDFIILDQNMAEQAFPGLPLSEVLGKSLMVGFGEQTRSMPVTGIVANTASRVGTVAPLDFPVVYSTISQVTERLQLSVVMPEGAVLDKEKIEQALLPLLPRLTDLEVTPLTERWSAQTLNQRISLGVILTMTGLTLFLAVIGVAGLTQMTTNHKRYELAVRMATGAKQLGLLAIVFKEALWMLVLGLSLGFVIAVFGYTAIRESVSIMPEFDWPSLLLLDGALVAIVIMAVALPAWRIIKADPMQALREL